MPAGEALVRQFVFGQRYSIETPIRQAWCVGLRYFSFTPLCFGCFPVQKSSRYISYRIEGQDNRPCIWRSHVLSFDDASHLGLRIYWTADIGLNKEWFALLMCKSCISIFFPWHTEPEAAWHSDGCLFLGFRLSSTLIQIVSTTQKKESRSQ